MPQAWARRFDGLRHYGYDDIGRGTPPLIGFEVGMPTPPLQVETRVSTMLARISRSIPAEGLTLQQLLDCLGERGLLIFCMILTIPFLLPVSIPGSSVPFGLLIALNAIGITIDRSPWLPERLMSRHLTAAHLHKVLDKGALLFQRLERLIHPRLLPLTHGPTMGRLNGVLLGLSGVLLMSPLPLPLSNTLPAYGVLFLAAGTLERDGYAILAGYVMVFLTLMYIGAVVMLGGAGTRALFSFI
jgi:hypothetical protein